MQLPSFPSESTAFNRFQMRSDLSRLAEAGVYLGTSSWKYEGWIGSLYNPDRYAYRGKLSKSRFERECLAEYAEVFSTVCVDAAYYDFPKPTYLDKLSQSTPDNFLFGFKVTDAITIKRYPNLPRFGSRAGTENLDFLNAELFVNEFLAPCLEIRSKVGVLMFEFSRFWPSDFSHGRDFVMRLDDFLGRLPRGWPYGVEIRNRSWLVSEYFECLKKHGVTHVFNSWEAMPSIEEQRMLVGSETNPELVAARFLLKPGRRYEDAVKAFSPYNRTVEANPSARAAGAALIRERSNQPGSGRTLIFVNNRLEGNALNTLTAMVSESRRAG